MPIHNIDGILNHLEKTAEDELSYLEETGPEFFTTPQLLRLRGQWEIKYQLFQKFLKMIIRIVAFSPVWIGLYFALEAINWPFLALTSLALFPFSFFLFFFGLYFIWSNFKGKGQLDRVGELIARELTKRSRSSGI